MITSEEILKLFTDAGADPGKVWIWDSHFVMPTPEWIQGELGVALRNFFWSTGIQYSDTQFDCNRFAKSAATVADWCWVRTEKRDAALAFGVFTYLEGFGGHAINVAVHRRADQSLYLAFYEPQPTRNGGQFIELCLTPVEISPEQLRLCLGCYFA